MTSAEGDWYGSDLFQPRSTIPTIHLACEVLHRPGPRAGFSAVRRGRISNKNLLERHLSPGTGRGRPAQCHPHPGSPVIPPDHRWPCADPPVCRSVDGSTCGLCGPCGSCGLGEDNRWTRSQGLLRGKAEGQTHGCRKYAGRRVNKETNDGHVSNQANEQTRRSAVGKDGA